MTLGSFCNLSDPRSFSFVKQRARDREDVFLLFHACGSFLGIFVVVCLIFIAIEMIYNVLISVVQQSKSYIYIHTHTLPWLLKW